MNYFRPLFPFLLGWALLLSTETFSHLALVNGLGQLLLFSLVVCLPIWRTGRMSYVDIGWPWGLVLLGCLSYWYSDGYWLRSLGVSLLLVLVGLRMGLGALKMWRLGLLKKEFPRYKYQRLRWQRDGKTNVALALQVDAMTQGLSNASFLAMPIFIIAANKVRFLRKMKKTGQKNQVCDVGLWRFCRHPNYFAEWMVWNGLVIAAFPSWLALQGIEDMGVWLLLGAGLIFTSRAMYSTLVYTTGAVPSEYYSQQKRPAYKEYQKSTNRFFPGPRRPSQ